MRTTTNLHGVRQEAKAQRIGAALRNPIGELLCLCLRANSTTSIKARMLSGRLDSSSSSSGGGGGGGSGTSSSAHLHRRLDLLRRQVALSELLVQVLQ